MAQRVVQPRPYAHLTDEELDAKIRALERSVYFVCKHGNVIGACPENCTTPGSSR